MSPNSVVTNALHAAAKEILQSLSLGDSVWTPVFDEDGNPDVPDTEREVLVFLCGDRKLFDERPEDAAWGMKFGWWDTDKHRWRVGGTWENYVTHWMDCPLGPEASRGG